MSAAIERVRCVLAAGARIADPEDALGREARARLVASSGLSPAGIELALREHLERDASEEELSAFGSHAATSRRAFVVLSANVCTAALRAIAFAVATAPAVLVRPSRRDPVVAELVLRALAEDPGFTGPGGRAALGEPADAREGDEVHVYGSDEAVAAHAGLLAPGVRLRGHGTGLGVAFVGATDVDAAAAALARDVVPFDQRGCLSPRFVLVAGGATRAAHLGRALQAALATSGGSVPRGPLDDATRGEIARYAASMRAVGELHAGADHAVGFDPAPHALMLPPAARVVHVVAAELDVARALLAPFWPQVTTLGVGSPGDAEVARGFSLRVARLGRMQKPPFDGPVDLRPYVAKAG